MRLFTLIVEYDGGTYISQYKARSATESLRRWAAKEPIGMRIGKGILTDLDDPLFRERPVELVGVKRVWSTSGAYRKKRISINIVETSEA